MAKVEAVLEETVCNRAGLAGYIHRKVSYVGRRGAPDRVFMGHGRTIWIEFKAKGEEPEPHQVREHRAMRLHGGAEVHVVDDERQIPAILPGYVIP